eukprot:TRINITY_DN15017_c0_g2_i1.p2 TRINITY_DN15017_c0_g2~~TRINITY_DN15017_c0_g2_i1.p2  ORF type:complete len:143 (-),score=24.45 TRINITY_DN15017_c0_g2_i1:112-540(-)
MVLGATKLSALTSFADEGLELREYYAAACGHCQALAPAWKEAMQTYSGPVTFRQIECNDKDWSPVPENEELCKDVHAFPTIKLFKDGKEVTDYQGDRSANDLVNFAKQHENLLQQSMPAGALCALPPPLASRRRHGSIAAFL